MSYQFIEIIKIIVRRKMIKQNKDNGIIKTKTDIILQEWKTMEDSIRSYDAIFMGIRGLSITISSAIIIASDKIGGQKAYIILMMMPVLFWFVELSLKTIQRQFIDRARIIEYYMKYKLENDWINGDICFKSPNIGEHFKTMRLLSKNNGILKTLKEASDFSSHVVYGASLVIYFLLYAIHDNVSYGRKIEMIVRF